MASGSVVVLFYVATMTFALLGCDPTLQSDKEAPTTETESRTDPPVSPEMPTTPSDPNSHVSPEEPSTPSDPDTADVPPTHQPTSQPTDTPSLTPTNQPTHSPTKMPTDRPTSPPTVDVVAMARNLMGMVQSPAFLEKINKLLADALPASMALEGISVKEKMSLVEFEAALHKCEGLNSLSIANFTELGDRVTKNDAGDFVVALEAELTIGGITCSGEAKGCVKVPWVGKQCYNVDPFKATMGVENLVPKITGKISSKDGKMCLGVDEVSVDLTRDMIKWGDISLGPSTIPADLIELAWNNLPIGGLITMVNNLVAGALQEQMNSLAAEQCF